MLAYAGRGENKFSTGNYTREVNKIGKVETQGSGCTSHGMQGAVKRKKKGCEARSENKCQNWVKKEKDIQSFKG